MLFHHEEMLPAASRGREAVILESPERMRIAFNTLSDAQRTKLSSQPGMLYEIYSASGRSISQCIIRKRSGGFLR